MTTAKVSISGETIQVQILEQFYGLPRTRFIVQSLKDKRLFIVFKDQLTDIQETTES